MVFFIDADNYHPKKNIIKISEGIPLEDNDRWPWLDFILAAINDHSGPCPIVLACSALKKNIATNFNYKKAQ